jgi:NAD-dependent deacetylase
VLRPPVVLFEEMLPEAAIDSLYGELRKGFDVVLLVGTTASFPYIVEPVLRTRAAGGFVAEVNPAPTDLSSRVDVKIAGRALDILPQLIGHISR